MEWLVPPSNRTLTPFVSRATREDPLDWWQPVDLVVYHYTATGPGAGPRGSERARMERWLGGGTARSSTHFVILRDGTVLQAAGLGRRTWHSGRSEFQGRSGVNAFSIGVDLENAGPLAGGWEPYTPEQVAALRRLVYQLVMEFPALEDPAHHVGHEDVTARKRDPGPAFPWDVVREAAAQAAADRPPETHDAASPGSNAANIFFVLAVGAAAWLVLS